MKDVKVIIIHIVYFLEIVIMNFFSVMYLKKRKNILKLVNIVWKIIKKTQQCAKVNGKSQSNRSSPCLLLPVRNKNSDEETINNWKILPKQLRRLSRVIWLMRKYGGPCMLHPDILNTLTICSAKILVTGWPEGSNFSMGNIAVFVSLVHPE